MQKGPPCMLPCRKYHQKAKLSATCDVMVEAQQRDTQLRRDLPHPTPSSTGYALLPSIPDRAVSEPLRVEPSVFWVQIPDNMLVPDGLRQVPPTGGGPPASDVSRASQMVPKRPLSKLKSWLCRRLNSSAARRVQYLCQRGPHWCLTQLAAAVQRETFDPLTTLRAHRAHKGRPQRATCQVLLRRARALHVTLDRCSEKWSRQPAPVQDVFSQRAPNTICH